MALIRNLGAEDIGFIASRVASRLRYEAEQNPLINPLFDADAFESALFGAQAGTWVCDEGSLTGHIYGAVLQGSSEQSGVWIGPDGVSFESPSDLKELYEVATTEWKSRGAREVFVWVLNIESSLQPWRDLGFEVLEQHQGGDIETSRASREEDLIETIEDPDTSYFIVENDGDPVAHCVSFPLPPRRSSHDETAHLSDVVVLEEHRRRGIATALIDEVLRAAHQEGARFAEVNWRSTNVQARSFWLDYGFTSTYVRLRANLD